MPKSRFARTGALLRVPTIDPNAMYLRREAKHLLRDIGDDALKELVDSGALRKIDIGNRQQFRGQWILDFVEERGNGTNEPTERYPRQ